jgi:hypothetical protein
LLRSSPDARMSFFSPATNSRSRYHCDLRNSLFNALIFEFLPFLTSRYGPCLEFSLAASCLRATQSLIRFARSSEHEKQTKLLANAIWLITVRDLNLRVLD